MFWKSEKTTVLQTFNPPRQCRKLRLSTLTQDFRAADDMEIGVQPRRWSEPLKTTTNNKTLSTKTKSWTELCV